MTARLLCLLVQWVLGVTAAQALSFSTVVIDAGHGGPDGGCVWNGLVEKRLCLDTAQRLERLLKSKGLRVVMTRRTDAEVSLESRAAIANRYKGAIFVSIHFNASKDRRVSGMEVFYRSQTGRLLAGKILRSMDVNLKGTNRGLFVGDFKVLRTTRMPAVLIECGYLSNRTEATRCGTVSHRQGLAQAIAQGILATRS
jgi:N-acetylmuramoyl-L-alanine amidase